MYHFKRGIVDVSTINNVLAGSVVGDCTEKYVVNRILTAYCVIKQYVAAAATYRLDEQSIEILSKIPAVNHATSYQIYWSLYVNGETISTLGIYKFPSFADGSLSPETYYASIEDAVNNILESIMGL